MRRRLRNMSLFNSLEAWSFRLFGGIVPSFLKFISTFKNDLEKGGIKIYAETYISLMFLIALLASPISIAALILLYLFRWIPLIFLVPAPLYVMVMFLVTPSMKAGERSHQLEKELPFAAAYVTVMASGGGSPYVSLKRLSNV